MSDHEGGAALLPEALKVDRVAVEKACKAAQALLRKPEPGTPRLRRRGVSQPSANAAASRPTQPSPADTVH